MTEAKTNIYCADTVHGPRLIRATNMREARKFALLSYLTDIQRATVDDMVEIAEKAGGIVIEDSTKIMSAAVMKEQQP